MEKLVKLLNEYSIRFIENKYLINWEIGENPIGIYGYVREYGLGWASKLIIISNEFGFIKWLVEKDKIDFDKALEDNGTFRYTFHKLTRIKNYEKLIMYLSIRDKPIEFLISVLK